MIRTLSILGVVSLLSGPAAAQGPPGGRPSPEMQRLARLIAGTYKVVERHHARPGGTEWVARGTATYVKGPDGTSVLEQYSSEGPRGKFSAVAVIWWDEKAGGFKHFECESGEPCGVVDDTGSWDGSAVVFRRRLEYQGRQVRAEDRYDFASPDAIEITSRFSMDGGPLTTSMTIVYTRVPGNANQ